MPECQNCKRLEEQNKAMYEALKELSKYIQFNMGNARPIYEKAIAVLAKIEGK